MVRVRLVENLICQIRENKLQLFTPNCQFTLIKGRVKLEELR